MIHSTAVVADDAKIGDDVEIGAWSVIGSGVEIGQGCKIGSHVVIEGPTRIGRDNRVFQFCSLGAAPQDKKYADEPTRLEIGDRNTIREFCTFNRGTVQDRSVTKIGDDNWVMAYVHIAHDCLVGNNVVLANAATLAGHVDVADHAILGGFTGVHQFCRIGEHSFLGMHTAISRDVPPYVMVAGQPASPRGINSEGLRRRGFGPDEISTLKNAYRLVYRSGKKRAEAVEELAALAAEGQDELNVLVEFLRTAGRGILR